MKSRILKKIDRCTGSADELSKRYLKITGRDCSDTVVKRKKQVRNMYITVIAAGLLLTFILLLGNAADHSYYGFDGDDIVSVRRGDAGRTYTMKAVVDGQESEITFYISPVSEDEEIAEEEVSIEEDKKEEPDIGEQIDDVIETIEEDPAKNVIMLPGTLEDGRTIKYRMKRDFSWMYIIAGMLLLLIAVYRSRFEKIEILERESRESVYLELPQFLNKLSLMMGGGIVMMDAVDRIVSEYVKMNKGYNYFYSRMADIQKMVRETNVSYEKQIMKFAGDTGVHEFIRIAGILSDNVGKGADLVSKIDAENRYLWFERKKKAEEMAKMAETKLTFPLVILLISLIVMTVSPAMLEM